MKDFETIKITNEKGEVIEAKAITVLKNPKNDRRFLLYSFDVTQDDVEVYASLIKKQGETYELDVISDKEDWNLIQDAINKLQEEIA